MNICFIKKNDLKKFYSKRGTKTLWYMVYVYFDVKYLIFVFRFITNSEHNRKRWENSEVECQRLNIEMNKALQECFI